VTEPSAFQTRYEWLISLYRAEILAGSLQPGDTLPSAREISERHGVSVPTAQKVAPGLAAQGLVTVAAGKRAVVTGPPAGNADPALASAAREVIAAYSSGNEARLEAAIRQLEIALGS
jgi:DNA-binding transcriptional regulator YhcF (GntR family)